MIVADLIDARILVELRNRLSFADAARKLKLPPATLSRRVAKMEERAGLPLFERTTRMVGITEAGRIAAYHAERTIDEAGAIDLSLDIMRDKPTGVIRLSTPVIFGQAILGPIVTEFLGRYPACNLAIELADRQIDLVEEAVDVVVRIGPLADDSLVAKPLGIVHAGLYRALGKGREPPPATIDELTGFPLGLLHPGFAPVPTLTLTAADQEERSLSVKPRLVCLNPWLLREAALCSDLIVVLPNIIAEKDVASGRLEPVLPGWLARRVPIHLAFTSPRSMRPAVRAFVDFAVAEIPLTLGRLHGSVAP